jgi:ribose 5-phosphate isomerase
VTPNTNRDTLDQMFERFTDRSRKAMALANQEAQRFNHAFIGTEHILLGLVKEGSGVGATVLKNLGIDLRSVRLEVEKIVKLGPDMVATAKLPQTPRAKKVVEYAILEARSFNHSYIGTEHMLLGLLREHDGVAAQILINLGLTLQEVRSQVLIVLGTHVKSEEHHHTEMPNTNTPLTPIDQAKQTAGRTAAAMVHDGMVIGLGTGSTADFFLIALADRLKRGDLKSILGLPTSRYAQSRARELGIPVTTLDHFPRANLTIDGADEIDPNLDLIKGRGGALLREKVVAQNSDKLVIIADETKLVPCLGTHFALPVEVTIFGHETQPTFLATLGCIPVLRRTPTDEIFITDNGNYIYDCKFEKITDPAAIDRALGSRAGIVESGLFLNMAAEALVATPQGDVQHLKRPPAH